MIVAITLTLWGKQTELQWDFLCDWGVTPPLLLCLLIDPLPLSLNHSPLPFTACLVSSFPLSHLPSHSLLFLLRLVLQANESESWGESSGPARPPACCGPYFLFHNVFTPRSTREIQLSITLPQVAANTFTAFKLATVTDTHASVSRVSRCCGLLFSKAAAVNLSFPEREGRREWPGGRPQLTSSHLLAQEAFARTCILYGL